MSLTLFSFLLSKRSPFSRQTIQVYCYERQHVDEEENREELVILLVAGYSAHYA